SLDALARAQAVEPSAARRFNAAIVWPPIMESREQIAARLAQVETGVAELLADPRPIPDPAREVDRTGFYMAYQGFDDTELQRKIACAYAAACPALEWTAPHVGRPRAPRKRIR